jgi:hypothetical protein
VVNPFPADPMDALILRFGRKIDKLGVPIRNWLAKKQSAKPKLRFLAGNWC